MIELYGTNHYRMISELNSSLFPLALLFSTYSSAFENGSDHTLLLIQCDSGHLNGDLIAYARYRIYDLRAKAIEKQCSTTHVLFIIHLPRKTPTSSFVGFQGTPWICYHLDDLQECDEELFSLQDALLKPISELFYSDSFKSEFIFPDLLTDLEDQNSANGEVNKNSPYQCRRLHNCIQAAASKLRDTEDSSERATQRIETLLQVLPKSRLAEAPLSKPGYYCRIFNSDIYFLL